MLQEISALSGSSAAFMSPDFMGVARQPTCAYALLPVIDSSCVLPPPFSVHCAPPPQSEVRTREELICSGWLSVMSDLMMTVVQGSGQGRWPAVATALASPCASTASMVSIWTVPLAPLAVLIMPPGGGGEKGGLGGGRGRMVTTLPPPLLLPLLDGMPPVVDGVLLLLGGEMPLLPLLDGVGVLLPPLGGELLPLLLVLAPKPASKLATFPVLTTFPVVLLALVLGVMLGLLAAEVVALGLPVVTGLPPMPVPLPLLAAAAAGVGLGLLVLADALPAEAMPALWPEARLPVFASWLISCATSARARE